MNAASRGSRGSGQYLVSLVTAVWDAGPMVMAHEAVMICSLDRLSGIAPSSKLGSQLSQGDCELPNWSLINSFSDKISQRFLLLTTENLEWYTKSGNILLLLVKGQAKIYSANKYSEILPVSQRVRVSCQDVSGHFWNHFLTRTIGWLHHHAVLIVVSKMIYFFPSDWDAEH